MQGTTVAIEMEDDVLVQQQLYLIFCNEKRLTTVTFKEMLPLSCLEKVQHLEPKLAVHWLHTVGIKLTKLCVIG